MVVFKFGGTSVATPEKIKIQAEKVKSATGQYQKIIVVVSAMGKTTDEILLQAKQIGKVVPSAELDALLNIGEMTTVRLLTFALTNMGVKAIGLNGGEAGILTTGNFGNSFISNINTKIINNLFNNFDVCVVAGFCGANKFNQITTLGRGGSDTTAVALASAFKCKCFIYTDVDGIFTIDPKLIKNPKINRKININNMLELSAFGVKALDTRCVLIASKNNCEINLKNSFSNSDGTAIVSKNFERLKVDGIGVLKGCAKIKIDLKTKSLANFLRFCKQNNIQVGGMVVSGYEKTQTVELIMDNEKLQNEGRKLQKIYKNCKIFTNCCCLTLVGGGFASHVEDVFKIINLLKNNRIKVYALNITQTVFQFWVNKRKVSFTLKLLKNKFNL